MLMYITSVPNRNSPPAILIRESYREGGKVKTRTIANITHWPSETIEAIRLSFKGKTFKNEDAFIIERSVPHGHVAAVLSTIKKTGLDRIIAARPSRERNLVMAMIAERLIHPASKLATTRLWHDTTLAGELGVEDADEDDLYFAMDWLYQRQNKIEEKLAVKHLKEGGHALYDVSSSYYEGKTCPLAAFGYNRDGKRGKPIIVYGILCDDDGRPIAVNVYPGNTGDPSTVPDQVDNLRSRFGLNRVVLVGDRGMLTDTRIEDLRKYPGIGWISSLSFRGVRSLVNSGDLQLSLFDRKNLAEIKSADYPGERLVVCCNPLQAEHRRRKRDALLEATEKALEKIRRQVLGRTRTPMSKVEIAEKAGAVINRYKMKKHFILTIDDGMFSFERDVKSIRAEYEIDGIYVIRTSEPEERLSAADAVRGYKNLTKIEKLFRTLKGVDIKVRPIRHREEIRVRSHIFICMLAYYVEWHMRRALSPLLFDDEELPEMRKSRDPVAKAEPSASARRKKGRGKIEDGLEVQSFESLMIHLGTMSKNRCRANEGSPCFYVLTKETSLQRRVFDLLKL